MSAVDQADSKGEEPGEDEEEQFSEEARKMAERAHRPIGAARHLATRRRDWTSEGIGWRYTHTRCG